MKRLFKHSVEAQYTLVLKLFPFPCKVAAQKKHADIRYFGGGGKGQSSSQSRLALNKVPNDAGRNEREMRNMN